MVKAVVMKNARLATEFVSSYKPAMRPPEHTSETWPDLPDYPSKGKRRILDQRWLDRLHREGIERLLADKQRPPVELGLAVVQFNQGSFWDCHETLEQVWLPERYPLRLFYQGLIKGAVGLLHLGRRNRRGAAIKLEEAAYTLAPFQPHFMGIDIERLRRDTMDRLTYLQRDGPVDWEAVGGLRPVLIVPPRDQGR